MADEDDTPGAGRPLPANLFAADRWAQEPEARPRGQRPSGLETPAQLGPGLSLTI
jgi:hypothetical protein